MSEMPTIRAIGEFQRPNFLERYAWGSGVTTTKYFTQKSSYDSFSFEILDETS